MSISGLLVRDLNPNLSRTYLREERPERFIKITKGGSAVREMRVYGTTVMAAKRTFGALPKSVSATTDFMHRSILIHSITLSARARVLRHQIS